MTVLKNFEGAGELVSSEGRTPVSYSIAVKREARGLKAEGRMRGSYAALADAFHRSKLKLQLSTGEVVDIVMVGLDATEATIAVNTPLPGF